MGARLQMEKLVRWFKQLSIPTTFTIYMFLCLLLALLLSAITMNVVENRKIEITASYEKDGDHYYLTTKEGKQLGEGVNISVDNALYSIEDQREMNVLSIVSIVAIPLYFTICIIVASFVFYRQKMKKPLALLNEATEKIANQQLDFTMDYPLQDELGRLCSSFETMRSSLEANHRYLWRMIDDRKQLNEAFSHDLRTPLTVLKGYLDLMDNYVQDQQWSKQKMTEMIATMNIQVNRLENYANSMHALQKLEGMEPSRRRLQTSLLIQQMKDVILILNPAQHVHFDVKRLMDYCELDVDLVMQVFENLVNNAMRYAKEAIHITLSMNERVLNLTIQDDGEGFSRESLTKAMEPYYRSEGKEASNHYGLGLYICKLICTKHEGELKIMNGDQRGAIVSASFKVN